MKKSCFVRRAWEIAVPLGWPSTETCPSLPSWQLSRSFWIRLFSKGGSLHNEGTYCRYLKSELMIHRVSSGTKYQKRFVYTICISTTFIHFLPTSKYFRPVHSIKRQFLLWTSCSSSRHCHQYQVNIMSSGRKRLAQAILRTMGCYGCISLQKQILWEWNL